MPSESLKPVRASIRRPGAFPWGNFARDTVSLAGRQVPWVRGIVRRRLAHGGSLTAGL